MISKKLTDALNKQINKEMASSYLYLGMATYFEAEGLSGFAHWMTQQAKEEMDHAMKIYKFLFEVGSKPEFAQLDAPKTEYESPLSIVKQVLKHEEFITDSINKLYELALEEKDYKTQNFLKWFIDEQVEEEASVNAILDKFKFVEGNTGLLFLDKQLVART